MENNKVKKELNAPTSVYNLSWTDKYGIEDIKNRRLFINVEIDDEIIESIEYHILRYNRLDKGIPKEKRRPILLYINSNGGSVASGFGLISVINASLTPVYTVNLAKCYSMGFLIFLAGEKRFSMPESTFLMHDGSSFEWNSTAKMKDTVDFQSNQIEVHIKNFIMSRSSLTDKQYEDKYRVEWYFYPEEGKTNGMVDYIVGKDCTIDDII